MSVLLRIHFGLYQIVEEGSDITSETCSVSVDSGATAVRKSGYSL